MSVIELSAVDAEIGLGLCGEVDPGLACEQLVLRLYGYVIVCLGLEILAHRICHRDGVILF